MPEAAIMEVGEEAMEIMARSEETALLRIRFVTSDDFINNGIRLFTSSEFSHTEVILPDGTYLGAHLDGGVQIRPANYCTPKIEKRYALPVAPDALQKMKDFAHAQVGKPYDVQAVAGILFHRDWDTPNAWFCSELVAAVANAGGLRMLNVQDDFVHLITPEMLHLSPYLIGRCYFSAGI